jgi:hypothetical protein
VIPGELAGFAEHLVPPFCRQRASSWPVRIICDNQQFARRQPFAILSVLVLPPCHVGA